MPIATVTNFLRYPGSKRRMLDFLGEHLPSGTSISGHFIEPFVGGGAIYFHLRPRTALLADINRELIELYLGIQRNPERIWQIYRSYPNTKKAYKRIRDCDPKKLTLLQKASRSLYLNRTCFKGMWRHNLKGKFNIGYGGQSRRWSIRRRDLVEISTHLQKATIKCSDFQAIIAQASPDDYVFLDPPYRPGQREQLHQHYSGRFSFEDHRRLAYCLREADKRGVQWGLTISNNRDIMNLYKRYKHTTIPWGTSSRIGIKVRNSGEVFVCN